MKTSERLRRAAELRGRIKEAILSGQSRSEIMQGMNIKQGQYAYHRRVLVENDTEVQRYYHAKRNDRSAIHFRATLGSISGIMRDTDDGFMQWCVDNHYEYGSIAEFFRDIILDFYMMEKNK